MILPSTKVIPINEIKGNGVVATERIPKGTITWVFDDLDREIPMDQIFLMSPLCKEALLTYSYRNSKGNLVFCWDHEKYINHSYSPNCSLTPYNFEIAIRDIEIGEELTNDYGQFNIIAPAHFDSEGTDRTTVYPDDLLRFSQLWDETLRSVFPSVLLVKQQLKSLLSEEKWEFIKSIAQGKTAPTSMRSLYFEAGKKNLELFQLE